MMNLPESIIPTIALADLHRAEPRLNDLPFHEVLRHRVLSISVDGRHVLLASRQDGMAVFDWLQDFQREIDSGNTTVMACDAGDFEALVQRIGKTQRALSSDEDSASSYDEEEPVENLSLANLARETSPIAKLLGSMLFDASRSKASDIHIQTNVAGAVIRYRLDGMLVNAFDVVGRQKCEQLISRLKVLSGLDVAERRVPQDGRMRVSLDGQKFELRVSIMPSIFGEDAVLRLLDRSGLTDNDAPLNLEHLGLGQQAIHRIRQLGRRPHGMLLVTGPTGSGKTTTLYGVLNEINDSVQKIITIEDPVEYQLTGVLQVPVNEKTGLTFGKGLRAVLRHDPDVILVGEIRDAETALIAIQAAMTGHLVFSTVHANSAIDVVGRLTHMGIDHYNLASALNGVVAQRLLRKVCLRCQQKRSPTTEEKLKFPELQSLSTLVFGVGCGECRGTGHRGRIACAEVLEVDDDLRDGIIQRVSPRKLAALAQATGMLRISAQALQLLSEGIISLEEYGRVAEFN
jgi:general secretion pathway protein E